MIFTRPGGRTLAFIGGPFCFIGANMAQPSSNTATCYMFSCGCVNELSDQMCDCERLTSRPSESTCIRKESTVLTD